MPEIAVIVLTFNEEHNLHLCLDSVTGWASRIFVVDSYSTDQTVDVALGYGDRGVSVVQHTFEDYSKQWNWALTKLPISAAWTLKLDADERVSSEFREEVSQLMAAADVNLEGIYFRRSFYFMRKKLEHCGQIGYDLRMWRTGTAQFEDRSVNEHAMVSGNVAYLKSYVDHVDHKALDEWISKHNRYSSLEALNAIQGNAKGDVLPRYWGTPEQRRVWLRRIYMCLPLGHLVYFVYHYIFRGGFLDGRGGFRYSRLRAQYQYWTHLKIIEYWDTGVLPSVEWPPRGPAHPDVSNSALQELVDRE